MSDTAICDAGAAEDRRGGTGGEYSSMLVIHFGASYEPGTTGWHGNSKALEVDMVAVVTVLPAGGALTSSHRESLLFDLPMGDN